MKTAAQMQSVVTRLASKHNYSLEDLNDYLFLEMEGFLPLVIQGVGKNLLSVCHRLVVEGDAVADPEVVFFTGYGPWVPVSIEQAVGGYRNYATLTEDHAAIAASNNPVVDSLARFSETWARNLEDQGWIEATRRVRPA